MNNTLIYKKFPTGLPVPGEHLAVENRPFDLDAELRGSPGGVVVEELWASFDPFLRGKMRDPAIQHYSAAFQLNEPIMNSTISRVIKSDSSDFAEGDIVIAGLPIAERAVITSELLSKVRKISNPYNLELGYFLGPLGMPGLTAFSGLYEIGKPVKGETIFISSAAGAVGQLVGQLAKRDGLIVIGSVGSDDKLDFIINEVNFDGGFNYKKEKPGDALARLAPDGIDIYFENVGGEHLEAALDAMKTHGRIIACGMVSISQIVHAHKSIPDNGSMLNVTHDRYLSTTRHRASDTALEI
jgi:NADPH-dependent curcumin reductase CurA